MKNPISNFQNTRIDLVRNGLVNNLPQEKAREKSVFDHILEEKVDNLDRRQQYWLAKTRPDLLS